MNTKEMIEFAVRAVDQIKGDDLYRAERAFAGLSAEQMQEEYGQSGKSRQEILQSYKDHANKCSEVIRWLKGLA